MSIDFIKSLYYEFLSYFVSEKIKYEIKGSCIKCGQCCNQIHSYGMKNEKDLKIMQFFLPHYRRFFIRRKDENNNIILSCKDLDENGKCKIYEKRPKICRDYPKNLLKYNASMIEGCGFEIIKKEFKDYL